MIVTYFPQSKGHNAVDDSVYARLFLENSVFWARTRAVDYKEHPGPLSIKCTLKGREIYEFDGVPVTVDESSYLILNAMQSYASRIESDDEVESFCLFFRNGLADDVLAGIAKPADRLLDDPELGQHQPVLFFPKRYHHGEALSPALQRLIAGVKRGNESQIWLDEQFCSILESLMQVHRETAAEVESLSSVRRTTRVELYRRLSVARDYIESHFSEDIKLQELARVACLSHYHFLRLFKEAFNVTPHQYLTRCRLHLACKLLRETETPVADICTRVGFSNLSAFSRLFRSHIGESPRRYRQIHAE